MTLSKAIGKLEVKSEITIVAKCIDPSVKLRPCLPIQCSVENKRIEGMVVMIPTGTSLHQARQLIIDYALQPAKLKEIKEKLKRNKNDKPLFNTQQYTRNFELGMHRVNELYLNGKKPVDIILN